MRIGTKRGGARSSRTSGERHARADSVASGRETAGGHMATTDWRRHNRVGRSMHLSASCQPAMRPNHRPTPRRPPRQQQRRPQHREPRRRIRRCPRLGMAMQHKHDTVSTIRLSRSLVKRDENQERGTTDSRSPQATQQTGKQRKRLDRSEHRKRSRRTFRALLLRRQRRILVDILHSGG